METYILTVDDKGEVRLDIFLAGALPFCPSRNFAQNLIEKKNVTVNGKHCKSHYKMHEGDKVVAVVEAQKPCTVEPENIPLDIFYEDEDLIVVNKPIGMTVHPAAGCYSGTLVNALVFHQENLSSVNDALRPGIVHRLDKETSGLILVAKNNMVHAKLAKQFEKRIIKKQYVAVVQGLVKFDEGLVDAPLGRHPIHRQKRAVLFADAKEAQTVYRVLKRFQKTTLISLMPKTGRTHQLRVHMAYLGHPILGDEKYGKKNSFKRLALHAQRIGFYHPSFSRYMEFSSLTPKEFLSPD
ncbi:MAG: RluA family pseudouridine synthase [Candidatus Aceula meridiana]|nr:RluA family pseudouridine synthase [Candidatus Aceula meridiana]